MIDSNYTSWDRTSDIVLTFETCRAVNSEIIKQVTSSWSIFIQQCSLFIQSFTSGMNLQRTTPWQSKTPVNYTSEFRELFEATTHCGAFV
jgi:hypothetical protein